MSAHQQRALFVQLEPDTSSKLNNYLSTYLASSRPAHPSVSTRGVHTRVSSNLAPGIYNRILSIIVEWSQNIIRIFPEYFKNFVRTLSESFQIISRIFPKIRLLISELFDVLDFDIQYLRVRYSTEKRTRSKCRSIYVPILHEIYF